MTSSRPTRRRFLGTISLALATIGLGSAPAARAAADPRLSALTGIFRARASARAIGAAYLDGAPLEADPATLLAALLDGDPHLQPLLAAGDSLALHRHLAARVSGDFAAGQTVFVNGWLLSRTESRLCGLCLFT